MKTHISFSLAGILLLVVAASTAVYINQSASTNPRSTADSSNLRQLDGSSDSTNPDQLGSQSQLDCSPTDDSAVCPKSQQPVVTRAAGDPYIDLFGTITGPHNGRDRWYGLGETIELVATISEDVTVVGTPILDLNSGGTAEYERTTNGNTLVFKYIVGEGDTTKGANANAGQDLDVDSFNLNGAQIVDDDGAELDTSLPTDPGKKLTGSGRNLKIDASSVPTIEFEINRFDQLSADSNLVDEEFTIYYQLLASDAVCDDSVDDSSFPTDPLKSTLRDHEADITIDLPADATEKVCLRLTEHQPPEPDLGENDKRDYQYIIYADSTDYPQLTIEDPASDAVTASVTDTVDGSSLPSFDYQVIDWDVSCNRALTLTDFTTYTTGVTLDYHRKVCFKAVDNDGHTVYQESKVYLDENFSIWLLIDNQDNLSVQTSTGHSPGYKLVDLADDCDDSLRASAATSLYLDSYLTVPTGQKACLYKEDPNNDNGDLYQLYADSTDYPQLTIDDPASGVVTATFTPADTILSYQAIDQNAACNQDLPFTTFTTYTTTGAPLVYDQKVCFKADSNGYTVYQESEVYLDLEITIIPVSNNGTDVVIKATATLNATMEMKLVNGSFADQLNSRCDGQNPLACCEEASRHLLPVFSSPPWTYDGSEVSLYAVDAEGVDNLLDAQGGIDGSVRGSLACFEATVTRGGEDYSATAAFYATPDTVAPVIEIVQPTDSNSLTASVSDDWDSDPTFEYKLITSEACDGSLSFTSYDGATIDLDPDQKACFYAEDDNDNTYYKESEVGVDLSPPTPPTITVSGVIDNQVSATATDDSGVVDSFDYQLIPAGTNCNETLTTPFDHPYIEGTSITLEYGQEACFKASDASGASDYRGSTPGLDITNPTIDITGPDGSNVVTATATDDDTGVTSFERQLITGEDCDGNLNLADFTSYDGSYITLVDGQSICFKATDGASNESYRGSTAGVDITKPTISITQSFNQITAATASDDVDGILPLEHKLITGEPCDGSLSFTSYDGATIDLDIGESVCFKATDAAGNEFYLGSAAGADTTKPTIDILGPDSNNIVSATAADDSGLVPVLKYDLILVDTVCNDTVEFFAPYDGPITLPIGKKACFRATDGAGNKFYAASAAGADTIPPTITITGPDISSNIVRATATDTSGVTPSIEALLINKNTDCDSTLGTTFDSYTAGDPLTLGTRQKACFKASDGLNIAYKDSAAANDISDPVITVTEPDANSQVSASATDDADDNLDLSYQIIAAGDTCDGDLTSFIIYSATTLVTIHGGQKACFRATDDAGRISYRASGAIPLNQPTITSISLNDVTKQTIIKKNGSISIKVDYSAGVEIDRPNLSTWPKLILNNDAKADFDADTTFSGSSQLRTTATSTSHYFNYRVDSGDDISELDVSSYDFNTTSVRRPITWDELDSALPVGSNLADDADIEVDASPPTIVVVQLATNQVGAIASDANGISYFYYQIYPSSTDCAPEYPSHEYDYQVITLEADQQACFYAGDSLSQRSAVVSSDAAITSTDTSPPLITISELAGGSVSATASDADQDLPVELKYQLIGIDATCGSALTTDFLDYSPGDPLSLELGQMACFRARNQAFLFHYLASAGFEDSLDPEIDVGLVVDNKVSATVDDDLDSSPSFEAQVIASTVNCGDSLTSGFGSYISGDVLSLDYGQKACFRATDSSGNTAHAASTIGKDLIDPQITVSLVSSDNEVSARASDDETGISSFDLQVISQTTACDDQLSFGTTYSNNQPLTLGYDQKACFRAVDGNDNTVYDQSDAGSDILPPVITITVLTSNQVSAIATDTVDSSLTFEYKYMDSQACDDSLVDWTSYTAADPVDLGTDQKVCFRAIDDAGNQAYKQSDAGADISPPRIVSVQAVSGFDGPRGIGDLVEIMVSFDEPVTVTGSPYLLVASSNTAHSDNPQFSYARQSSDGFGLIFSYTVQDGNQLTNINGRLFFIDSAQIVDAHDNRATDFSLPAANNLADNNDIDLDGIAPAISVVAVDSNSQTSATIFEEIDDNPTFEFQIIDNLTDCDDSLATSFAGYTVSDLKTLTAAQRVCFRASDAAGNITYKVSGGGLDSSPPQIVATVNSANQVTATATDNSGLITGFWYVLITTETCANGLSFVLYEEGDAYPLAVGQKACFKAKDGNGLFGYAESDAGADKIAPIVTVSAGSAADSFKAVDDETTDTTWHYIYVDAATGCNADDADFASAASYTPEGSDLDYGPTNNQQYVCFRSADADDNYGYGVSDQINIDTSPLDVVVTAGAVGNTYQATSSYDQSQSWQYKFVAGTQACDDTVDFGTGAETYSADTPVSYTATNNDQIICFVVLADSGHRAGYGQTAPLQYDDLAPLITVTDGSSSNSFKAVDDDSDTTVWRSLFTSHSSNCALADYQTDGASYREGDDIDYTAAQDGQKICFSSQDNTHTPNIGYAGSPTIDLTAPTILVEPVGSDNKVKAIIRDDVDDGLSPEFKIVDKDTVCDDQLGFGAYRSGDLLTLPYDQKACFRATDANGNTASDESDPGADIIPPAITVSSVSAANQVSASVTDAVDNSPDFSYQLITTATVCDSDLSSNFSNYTADDLLELAVGQKACFKATDDSDNSAYADSDSGDDISPPTVTVSRGSADDTYQANDNDSSPTTWVYVLITNNTCNSTTSFSGSSSYNEGDDVVPTEADNTKQLCFRSTDSSGNHGYGSSTTINVDQTAPVVTVSRGSADDTYQANDNDNGTTTWAYVLITNNTCDSTTNFSGSTSYTEGDDVVPTEADNTKQICFRSTDSSGNHGYGSSTTINVDQTAPTVTVSRGSADDTFQANDNDSSPTTWAYVLITNTTCNSTTSFSGSTSYNEGDDVVPTEADNTKQLCFRSTDSSGNHGYGSSTTINVDQTAPVVTVSAGSAADSFKAVDDEAASTDWAYVFITNNTCNSTTDFSSPSSYTEGDDVVPTEADNTKQLCFRSTDNSDNAGYGSSATINVDQTAPVVTVSRGSADNTFQANDNDNGPTTWAYVLITNNTCNSTTDFSSPSSYTEGDDVVPTEADNTKRLCFRSTDNSDNAGYGSSATISVDQTAPVVTVSAGSAADSFKAVDDEAASTDWAYVFITNNTCNSTTNFDTPTSYREGDDVVPTEADNTKQLCFRSTDNSDNAGYGSSATINVDQTAPVVTVSAGSAADSFKAVDDEAASTDWAYVFITNNTCNSTTDFSSPSSYTEGDDVVPTEADNTKQLCFRSTDNSDNAGYGSSATINVDQTAPVVTVSRGSADNTFQANDNDNGPTTWAYVFITNNTCNSTTNFDTPTSYREGDDVVPTEADNTKQLCFRSTDNSDNAGYGSSATINVDQTAPVVTVSAGSAADSFKAVDDEAASTDWAYVFITNNTCNSTTDFSSPSSYTEGDDVVPTEADNTKQLCFRSTDSSGNHGYASSTTINVDQTAPVVTVSRGSADDTFQANDDDNGPTTWAYVLITNTTCNSTTDFSGSTSYNEGDDVVPTEADNTKRLCFRSTDSSGNHGYGSSATISVDTTAPQITVSPLSLVNQVSASVSDDTDLNPSFGYQFVAEDAVCGAGLSTAFTTYAANFVLMVAVGQKACFKASDDQVNTSYQQSTVGVDDSPPQITVTSLDANNQLTASASDNIDPNPDISYQQLADSVVCGANLTAGFSDYDGSAVSLALNHKLCFRATDAADNTSYQHSPSRFDLAKPQIVISPVNGANQVSAIVSDADDPAPSFYYQLVDGATVCGASLSNFTGYIAGDQLSLAVNHKACFKASDSADNSAYAASTVGLDISQPTLVVTAVSATNQVSASVTDDNDLNPSFGVQLITDQDCGDSLTDFSVYDGRLLSLAVDQRACFKASDSANNSAYAVSGLGVDISSPQITVGALDANNQVSASVSDDNDLNPSFGVQLITTQDCGDGLTDFSAYDGSPLSLAAGQRACFRASDSADNRAYAVSGLAADQPVVDSQPPVITISGLDAGNNLSATASDDSLFISSFGYQFMAAGTSCGDQLTSLADYVAGSQLSLRAGQQVCFRAADSANNTSYLASAAGADISAPTITTDLNTANNQLMITVVDDYDANPSLSYQLVTTEVCGDNLTNFTGYTGTIQLTANSRACLMATDAAGNSSYLLSEAGIQLITAVGSSSRPASSTISQLAGDSGLPKLFWLGAAVFTVAGLLAVYGRRRMI